MLDDGAPQAIDLLGITPLLWTAMQNLFRTQPTMIEQVDQSLLARTGQRGLEGLPKLVAINRDFHAWLTYLVCHKPSDCSRPAASPQRLHHIPLHPHPHRTPHSHHTR